MPIYEYECTTCGHRLDTLQKVSDAPLSDCPECGKPSLQKLVSASSFQLKGTGWYATDFKNKPGTEAPKTSTTTTSSKSSCDTASTSTSATTTSTEAKKSE